jgi:hypothetical protein
VRLAPLAIAAWLGAVGAGIHACYRYATRPGEAGVTPARWPVASKLSRAAGTTAIMFVHPECPCSRASLHELAEAAIGAAPGARVVVVFANRHSDDGWDLAGRIPGGVRVVDDGAEAARFGARTSGFTVVYGADGALAFAGGVTGSRGHVGDNTGRQAVAALLRAEPGPLREHAVFGCAIADAGAGASGGSR